MAKDAYLRPLSAYVNMSNEQFIDELDDDLMWAEIEATYDIDDDGST